MLNSMKHQNQMKAEKVVKNIWWALKNDTNKNYSLIWKTTVRKLLFTWLQFQLCLSCILDNLNFAFYFTDKKKKTYCFCWLNLEPILLKKVGCRLAMIPCSEVLCFWLFGFRRSLEALKFQKKYSKPFTMIMRKTTV